MPAKTTRRDASLNALTLDDLDTLMKLVKRNGVEEIEIESKDLTIRLRGGKTAAAMAAAAAAESTAPTVVNVQQPAPMAQMAAPTAMAAPVEAMAPAPVPTEVPAPVEEAPPEPETNYIEVKSPMVGTFYRAPSPDASPFVQVGDRVTEDTVMCIIEAMKLMNEIKAEVSGVIAKVLVENGHPVEFGQTIFLVEPSE